MSLQFAARYFLVQAIAVVAWWALLVAVPESWAFFEIRGAPRVAFGAFGPGDLGIVAVGSAMVASRYRRPWAGHVAWMVAGAMAYAALYTVTTAALQAAHPLGAILMLPAAGASLVCAATIARAALREAMPSERVG